MHMQLATDVGQRALIQIPGRQQKAFFCTDVGKRLTDGYANAIIRSLFVRHGRGFKFHPRFKLLIKADFSGSRPVSIHVFPREHRTQPAFKRAPTHVVVQLALTASFTVAGNPVEIGIQPVSKFATSGFVPCDAIRRLV